MTQLQQDLRQHLGFAYSFLEPAVDTALPEVQTVGTLLDVFLGFYDPPPDVPFLPPAVRVQLSDAGVRSLLRDVPLVSWTPNLGRLVVSARLRGGSEAARATPERIRADISREPFCLRPNTLYVVNWTGEHANWRDAVRAALQTEVAKLPADERADAASATAAVLEETLYTWYLNPKKRFPAYARKFRKIERATGRAFIYDTLETSDGIDGFRAAHPGVQYIVRRGIPYTKLAERVFAGLYQQLGVFVGTLRRRAAAETARWIDPVKAATLVAAFDEKRVFLVEMDPFDGTASQRFGFVRRNRMAPYLVVNVRFRFYGTPQLEDYVPAPRILLRVMLHELSHLLRQNASKQDDLKGYTSEDALLERDLLPVQPAVGVAIDTRHGRNFWRAFQYAVNVAAVAGLFIDPTVEKPDWTTRTWYYRVMAVPTVVLPLRRLLAEFEAPGGFKRARTLTDASDVSEDLDADDDDDDDDPWDPEQPALLLLAPFRAYLGRSITRAQLAYVRQRCARHGSEEQLLAEVLDYGRANGFVSLA